MLQYARSNDAGLFHEKGDLKCVEIHGRCNRERWLEVRLMISLSNRETHNWPGTLMENPLSPPDSSPAPERPHAIELYEVTKTYEGGKVALANASLTVHRGELLALVGPNGAGKSTVL